MDADRQIVCLNMIVKNEAPVIARCLESVRPIIDYWVIVDTGSTDGTQDAIRAIMADVPGELHERPWRDFAHNRTEALDLARPHGDYVLIIDADDVLEFDPQFKMPVLDADSYQLRIVHSSMTHARMQIVRAALPWVWRGVVHEFLTCEGASGCGLVEGMRMRINHDGARRRDPETYRRDAEILATALETETDPFMRSRYQFYLAQSYRDCGEKGKALQAYLERAELGFWIEEVFISLYSAAKLQAALERPFDEVVATYLRAAKAVPGRLEALHGACRYCRLAGRNKEGYELAKDARLSGEPPNGLFVEPWIYEYGLLDEFSINAYWAGAYAECLEACLKLLEEGKLPSSQRDRVIANARFAVGKIPAFPDLGSAGKENLIDQHPIGAARALRPRLPEPAPRILVAILAKQKEAALPLYLKCIEALDYPKSSIVLYIRTNNNTDRTEEILRQWIDRVAPQYAAVEFDASDVPDQVEKYRPHEWNAVRFKVLGRIRNLSLRKALDYACDFYFTTDVDNFIRRCTLRELVALNVPIVAPFLRSIKAGAYYSNYHAEVDDRGYYKKNDQYQWVLNRFVRGLIEMPVVHCTYLLRTDVIPELTYEDVSGRHEYVVFSESARRAGIPQYLDNRQVYGYITFEGEAIERASTLLEADLRVPATAADRATGSGPGWIRTVDDGARNGPNAVTKPLKTLIFCTAFAKTPDEWDERYARWLQAIRTSGLIYDGILVVDDGSPVLPDWPDAEIRHDTGAARPPAEAAPLCLFHFENHLGRRPRFNFPGWYRSFAFAGRYAHACGFEKIIHIESDAFVIGSRLRHYLNNLRSGWTALWCPRWKFPETALQVIAGEAIPRFANIEQTHPHDSLVGRPIELQLPFDHVEKGFIGDRYGEYLRFVPGNAEFAAQAGSGRSDGYHWWLNSGGPEKKSTNDTRDRPRTVHQASLPTTPCTSLIAVRVPQCATVVAVAPRGYAHAAALAEVAETLLHGLRGLGYDATLTYDTAAPKGRTIIVGAHLLAGGAVVPGDAIIYNTEHVESAWIKGEDGTYRSLLREHEVWDYSASNAAQLTALLGMSVRHVPLGYVPDLARIATASEQDIDVLFYGSMNQRRNAVLDQLRQSGLAVKHVFGVYGEQRDALIARSKIVLNMHFYLPGTFEIVRVAYPMANRKVVVAEVNPGEEVDADLLPGLVAVPYERLAESCRHWADDNDRRRELEETAFRTFSARAMTNILRQHLGQTVCMETESSHGGAETNNLPIRPNRTTRTGGILSAHGAFR